MKVHWTERSIKDYLFRIRADFIAQLAKKMESLNISQDELAKRLGVSKGRVSQLLNHYGNITLAKIIEYARALDMKVSIVAYEDDDPKNKKGPVNSEIFKICWEQSGKPHDFWAFQDINMNKQIFANITEVSIPISCQDKIVTVEDLSGFPVLINETAALLSIVTQQKHNELVLPSRRSKYG